MELVFSIEFARTPNFDVWRTHKLNSDTILILILIPIRIFFFMLNIKNTYMRMYC